LSRTPASRFVTATLHPDNDALVFCIPLIAASFYFCQIRTNALKTLQPQVFRAPQSCAIVAFFIIARAAFGYLFLVLIVRIVGRRPGKQLTPFEFVLIFYLGGLTLTGMLSGAVCEKLIGVGPLGKSLESISKPLQSE